MLCGSFLASDLHILNGDLVCQSSQAFRTVPQRLPPLFMIRDRLGRKHISRENIRHPPGRSEQSRRHRSIWRTANMSFRRAQHADARRTPNDRSFGRRIAEKARTAPRRLFRSIKRGPSFMPVDCRAALVSWPLAMAYCHPLAATAVATSQPRLDFDSARRRRTLRGRQNRA
jgi:hypothetical protein